MKHLKILGLAAVAAMALMAFVGAGTASATTLCKTAPVSNECAAAWHVSSGSTLDFSLKPTTSAVLKDTSSNTLDTCTGSTIKGNTTNTGGASTAINGDATSLTWTGCTFTTDTTLLGTLSIAWTSGNNGTVKASGFKVTVNGLLGDCVYQTGENLTLGTLTGGNPATLEIKAVPVTEISGFCPSTETWTATYVSTEPAGTLDVTDK